jgi:sugar O-acyltransferase (sialic acid O-acetyltransferase NeuD family)
LKTIFIYGAGGLGREMLGLIAALPEWNVGGFYDDGIPAGTIVRHLPVLGGVRELQQREGRTAVVIALGDPSLKTRVAETLRNLPVDFPALVHPSALLQDPGSIRLSPGVVVTAGCILTTSITVGRHALLNLHVTVGHDTEIGDFSSIMPGVNLAGKVTVGTGVLIGSGANILNNIRLGDRSRIGAGAVVLRDTPPDTTSVGVPAIVVAP